VVAVSATAMAVMFCLVGYNTVQYVENQIDVSDEQNMKLGTPSPESSVDSRDYMELYICLFAKDNNRNWFRTYNNNEAGVAQSL
jgi:hypothetical protein